MIDLLSSAVRLGRAALQPSTHTAESKLPPPPKKKAPNYAPIRTLSRAFHGANNFVFSLWDGLTADERERRRVVGERKTLLIFHMKNVGADASLVSYLVHMDNPRKPPSTHAQLPLSLSPLLMCLIPIGR